MTFHDETTASGRARRSSGPRAGAALLVLTLLSSPAPAAAETAAGYEEPPILRAADRVAADLLTGPYHRVDDRVVNDGFMNHFVIRSDFGDFEASSERMVGVRVREVYAIAELRELSRSDAFASALKGAATAPVDAAKQIVDDPVGTAQALPGGITRKARGLYYKTRKTTHQVKGEVAEARQGDDCEAAAGDQGGAAVEAGEGCVAAEEKPSTTDQAKAAAKDYVGYTSAYRELAKKLQVDPYTSNPVLRAELTRLAQAAFAAGAGLSMVTPIPRAVGVVGDVADLAWDQPPEEVERLNNLALRDLGIDKETRLAFFAGDAFTTTTQTLLVQALQQLAPLDGRRSFVDLALEAEDEADAWILTRAARLLSSYHRFEAPLARLAVAGNDRIGRAVVGITAANQAIVPVAFDHVTWRPGMEGDGPLAKLAGRQLWLAGTLSPRAERELGARGFEIHAGVAARFEELEKKAAGPR